MRFKNKNSFFLYISIQLLFKYLKITIYINYFKTKVSTFSKTSMRKIGQNENYEVEVYKVEISIYKMLLQI